MSEENEFEPSRTSKSGIRYFLQENNTFPSLSLGVFVKSGSRYEEPQFRGISHLIEHTVFKGTKKRNAFEISREIEKVGGEINAYTSIEHTVFYVRLLSKDACKGFEILSDILKNPLFQPELVERERRVVLEEIHEYYDDPQDICQTEALKSIWGDDPVANTPLGSEETVKNMRVEDLKSYFSKMFNHHNLFVSVAGDIDDITLRSFMDEYFSDFNSNSFEPQVLPPVYHFEERKYEKDTAQIHVAITLKGSGLFVRENILDSLFTTVLGGNMSSRLFQRLREDSGLVYTVYAYPVRLSDAGGTVVYASTTSENLAEVEGIIHKEVEDIRRNGLSKSEFEDAKSFVRGNLLLGLESTSSKMQRNGVQGLFLGKVKRAEKLLDDIDGVSFDKLNNYIESLLDDGTFGRVVVGKV